MIETSASIASNLELWLAHHGLAPLATFEILETKSDRLFIRDKSLAILEWLLANDGQVSGPDNPIEASLHGKSVILSVRERATPSLQLCVHRVIDANSGERAIFHEIDFDFAPPTGPVLFARHASEVLHNAVTGNKTDQVEVAKRLAERFKENVHDA